MILNDLLNNIIEEEIPENFCSLEITALSSDSRKVKPGALFVAVKGVESDGADYIDDAVSKGAKVIVYNGEKSIPSNRSDVFFVQISDSSQILRSLAKRFYGDPSSKVNVIGVTGTNGKTTITYLLESILKTADKLCGVIGTVNYRINGEVIPSTNTTPGVLENQKILSELAKENTDYCVMEVSSHALDQNRVNLINFRAGIFTNLTQEHLDYHKNQEAYFQAKAKLFSNLSEESIAVINREDRFGEKLLSMTKAKIVTYGFGNSADVRGDNLKIDLNGSSFTVVYEHRSFDITTQLIGRHNVLNILAAVSLCLKENIDVEAIQKGIKGLPNIPGRLERIEGGQGYHVFVDYAHTDDGLRNVLESLKLVAQSKIILVFGCGGDRDKTKRPRMGKIAGQLADLTIIANDNPRSEDPEVIADEIAQGFEGNNYEIILNRKEAIERALKIAQKDDIVLLAGKGHENYQIFKDKTEHFDDREVAREFI